MNDVVGYPDRDNPVIAWKLEVDPPRRSGSYQSTSGLKLLDVYNNYALSPTVIWHHNDVHNDPGEVVAVSRGAAMANPNLGKDEVNLPLSLAELRDLPRLALSKYFRRKLDTSWSEGRGHSQTNSVVESEFGWAPMLRDVQNLFLLPAAVERRLKQLENMRRFPDRKISRTRTAWTGDSTTFYRTGQSANYEYRYSTTRDYRVTSRWRPQSIVKNIGDVEMAELAQRLALGLTPQSFFTSAWDILPWSWCIDWFINLGDLISLSNNAIACHSNPTVCTAVTRTVIDVKVIPNATTERFTNRPGQYVHKSWSRTIYPVLGLGLSLPILSTEQTLILSSLSYNFGSP